MEIRRVNEEAEDGNYVIEMFYHKKNKWYYITTEFSVSVATTVMVNLNNAIGRECKVLSRRSDNMVLSTT